MNDNQGINDENADLRIAKAVREKLFASGELQRHVLTPVDNTIREILESFTTLEDANLLSGSPKNPEIVKCFKTNPKLLALVRTVDNCDLVCWLPYEYRGHSYVPLHGGATYSEVAEIVAALFRVAEQKASDQNTAPPDTIKALCANFPDNLPEGIAFQAEGRIWKGPDLSSDDLFQETLSAWHQLYETGYMPWQGEGSDPWVTIQGDEYEISVYGFYYIIGDDSEQSVRFNRNQLKVALENVRQDIKDFLVPLRNWAQRYYPEEAEELVACFSKAFVDTNDD